MLVVAGSSKFLTCTPSVGFATMKTRDSVLANEQRWEQVDAAGSGPAVLIKNVANDQCLRANPFTNAVVRTRACEAGNKEQQWVLSGGRFTTSTDSRGTSRRTVDRRLPEHQPRRRFAKFNGTSNQVWSTALF